VSTLFVGAHAAAPPGLFPHLQKFPSSLKVQKIIMLLLSILNFANFSQYDTDAFRVNFFTKNATPLANNNFCCQNFWCGSKFPDPQVDSSYELW
jgi:hypothetical protein